MTDELKFRTICHANGLPLDDAKLGKLADFVRLLTEWNAKINLISRIDAQNLWLTHVLHSVSVLFFVPMPQGARVLDLGTGGGLPGVPLAIARSDLQITLLDSIRKKAMVVDDVTSKLHLGNTHVITGRAEDVGREKVLTGRYDIVIARAVAPLHELLKWSRPFLRQPDRAREQRKEFETPFLLAMKGGDLAAEIDMARLKSHLKQHSIIDLVFKGSEELSLQDKKLVIAYL